jgi:hypothetical protein
VQNTAPGLDVPRVLPALIGAVKELKGVTTEGIFRISPTKPELEALHKQFEDAHASFELTAAQKQSLTAHVPAALLKQWLRSLSEPLIPELQYGACLALAKDAQPPINSAANKQAVAKLMDGLPQVNRRVVELIAALVKELCVPANAKRNRMGVEALAIVFAPSFLRSVWAADGMGWDEQVQSQRLQNSQLQMVECCAVCVCARVVVCRGSGAADPIEILQNSKFETRSVVGERGASSVTLLHAGVLTIEMCVCQVLLDSVPSAGRAGRVCFGRRCVRR